VRVNSRDSRCGFTRRLAAGPKRSAASSGTSVRWPTTRRPETVEALKLSLASRPKPKTEKAADKFFVTRCGDVWVEADVERPRDAVSCEWYKLVKTLDLYRRGVGIYSLRHVFRTIAGGAGDLEATRLVMGHSAGGIDEEYLEEAGITDDRVERVVEHVRKWLFADGKYAPQLRVVG
jgi:hypothetical protein